MRSDLLNEIDGLKAELQTRELEHGREVAALRDDREREVTAVINEKSRVSSDAHSEILRLRDENALLRSDLSRTQDELSSTRAEL